MRNFSFPIAVLLSSFLLFPFAFLLIKLNAVSFSDPAEVLWALKNSSLQAAGSATLAMLIGFVFFTGLVQVKQSLGAKSFRWLEILCMVPGMMPSLFSILILMSLLHPFPIGLKGIVVVHGVLYAGFIALSTYQLVQDKAQSLVEVAYVLGASQRQILWQTMRLLRWDLFSMWILIFAVCFTSFAVPLTVGGGWGTTLEVLIYEKIRLSNAWGEALSLALLQSLFLFLFSFLQRPGVALQMGRFSSLPILGNILSAILMVFGLLCFYGTFVIYSVHGWIQLMRLSEVTDSIWQTVPATIMIGLFCGLTVYVFLQLTALSFSQNWLRRFLIGYVAPSTSLAGLIVILLGPDHQWLRIGFFVLAFVSLIVAGLYRMGFAQKLVGLKTQVEVARVLGADIFLIFWRIIFPQMHPLAARLAGIAALWMVGDFALCRVIFSQDIVLAQVVQGLINSYHLDIGMAVMNVVILIGFALYFLFEGFGRVFSHKAQ